MGKKIILVQKQNHQNAVDSKTLTEYTFAEHIMNINSKLNICQAKSLIQQVSPLLAESFIIKNKENLNGLIEAFLISLDDNSKTEFSQQKSEKDKLIFFFSYSISMFQKQTQEEGFAEALEIYQDFYLLALDCFERVPLNIIANINKEHESFI